MLTVLDFNEAQNDGHQLNHKQIICTYLQRDNQAIIQFFMGQMLCLMASQWCQGTEDKHTHTHTRLTALFPGLPG